MCLSGCHPRQNNVGDSVSIALVAGDLFDSPLLAPHDAA
jgi:hypothetical protein